MVTNLTDFKIKKFLQIGWRINKGYFLVTNNGLIKDEKYVGELCTEFKFRESFRVNSTTLCSFILSMNNSFLLLPFDVCSISSLLCIYHINVRGSLSDIIYQNKNPLSEYYKKYQVLLNSPCLYHDCETIVSWAKDILKGLDYLHKNNLFHGNLHSGNIFIDESNRARISGMHLSLLGYHNRNIKQIMDLCNISNIIQIDILSFFIVLFEVYYEQPPYLSLLRSDENRRSIDHSIVKIENFLSTSILDRELQYSSIQQILDSSLFQEYKTSDDVFKSLEVPTSVCSAYNSMAETIVEKIKSEQQPETKIEDKG